MSYPTDPELQRLNLELGIIEQDIEKARKKGTDLNFLFKEKQNLEEKIEERETELSISNPIIAGDDVRKSNQIVFSTSLVREKDNRIVPK